MTATSSSQAASPAPAATDLPRHADPDLAPLWLPAHQDIVSRTLSRRRQTAVEGLSWPAQLRLLLFEAPATAISRLGAVLGGLAFVALLPILASGGGWGNLARVLGYHGWTLLLMLILSARLRSVSVARTITHFLTGALTVVAIVYYLAGPLTDLSGTAARRVVWVVPPLEEVAKALPLLLAIFVGRRSWRHPGMTDLVLLGFAVGAGYGFHEDALWERVVGSGFEGATGFFVPSMLQTSSLTAIGHAGWTALVGFAIGLLVLYRRKPIAVVTAGVVILAVMGDHMSINDGRQRLGWVRDVLFEGNVLVIMLFGAFVLAPLLDQRRLANIARRDHLFGVEPSSAQLRRHGDPAGDPASLRAIRYVRLRNGAHNAIAAHGEFAWPCASAKRDNVVVSLASAARSAGVTSIPPSLSGWDLDPDGQHGYRFQTLAGWTTFVSDGSSTEHAPTKQRPEATPFNEPARDPQFWRTTLLLSAAVVAAIVGRLLSLDDLGPGTVDFVMTPDRLPGPMPSDAVPLSLPDAPNGISPGLTLGGSLAGGQAGGAGGNGQGGGAGGNGQGGGAGGDGQGGPTGGNGPGDGPGGDGPPGEGQESSDECPA